MDVQHLNWVSSLITGVISLGSKTLFLFPEMKLKTIYVILFINIDKS